jgi:hypothetical protein
MRELFLFQSTLALVSLAESFIYGIYQIIWVQATVQIIYSRATRERAEENNGLVKGLA